MSAFSRDDEQANPWRTDELARVPEVAAAAAAAAAAAVAPSSPETAGDNPFYPLSAFQVAQAQPVLPFPPCLLVSDNYFRPRWIGLGERRLKNIVFVLEVQPGAKQRWFKKRLGWVHTAILKSGEVADANVAAAKAIQMMLMEPTKASHLALESATGSSEAVRGKNDDEVESLLRKLEEEDALY